jgi:hypothetical protein
MKRSILPLIALIALVAGLNAQAFADSGAQSSAKPSKGKSKACKSKGKGKAGKSASASAKPKKGAKGKCKAKKGKGKATSGGLSNGTYEEGATGVELVVTGNGSKAVLSFEARGFCVPIRVVSPSFALKGSGATVKGSGKTVTHPGGVPVSFGWSISIEKATLGYVLDVDMRAEDPTFAGCTLKDRLGGVLVQE